MQINCPTCQTPFPDVDLSQEMVLFCSNCGQKVRIVNEEQSAPQTSQDSAGEEARAEQARNAAQMLASAAANSNFSNAAPVAESAATQTPVAAQAQRPRLQTGTGSAVNSGSAAGLNAAPAAATAAFQRQNLTAAAPAKSGKKKALLLAALGLGSLGGAAAWYFNQAPQGSKDAVGNQQAAGQDQVQAEDPGKKFDFAAWQGKWGKTLDIGAFKKDHPYPFGQWFGGDKPEVGKDGFIYIGPLGLRVLPHDSSWGGYKTYMDAYPSILKDKAGLLQNCLEVLAVDDKGPCAGKVKPGDLILAINDQQLVTSSLYRIEQDILLKDKRGLERHVGDLIDRAEALGEVKLSVVNVKDVSNPTFAPREWKVLAQGAQKTHQQRKDGFNFDVALDSKDETFRLVATDGGNGNGSDGMYFEQVYLVKDSKKIPLHKLLNKSSNNGYGSVSVDEQKNRWRVHAPCDFEFYIPKDMAGARLQGIMRGFDYATIDCRVESIPAATLPREVAAAVKQTTINIPQLGSFGESYNPDSAKVANMSKLMSERLLQQQRPDGSWPQTGGYTTDAWATCMCALALMSTGEQKFDEPVRKAAHFVAKDAHWCDWAIPNGLNLMFLSEYYLRSKDESVIPAIEILQQRCKRFVASDYVAGHKTHPGYSESGYIGGGGFIAAGLALASHTSAKIDEEFLGKMLDRAQDLAPDGNIPYGRTIGRKEYKVPEKAGQSYSLASGPYVIASRVAKVTPKVLKDTFEKRYTSAPYGNADHGHASSFLSYFWGIMGTAVQGNDEAYKQHLSAFTWKMALARGYEGLVMPNNSYRTEYQGAEGVVDYYQRAAMWVIILNAHKKNLAMTGMEQYQNKQTRDLPKTTSPERIWLKRTQRNYTLAASIIGSKQVSAVNNALNKLMAMQPGEQTSQQVMDFYASDAIAAAKAVANDPSILADKPLQRAYLIELLLGVDVQVTLDMPDKKPAQLVVRVNDPMRSNRNAMNKDQQSSKYFDLFAPKGTYSITDASATFLPAKLEKKLDSNREEKIALNALPDENVKPMELEVSYMLCGIPIKYTRPLSIAKNLSPFINCQLHEVLGTTTNDFENWTLDFKPLGSQEVVNLARGEGDKFIVMCSERAGKPYNLMREAPTALLKGTACKFGIYPGNFVEGRIVNIHKLDENNRLVNVTGDNFRVNTGSMQGDVSLMGDMDLKTKVVMGLEPNKDFVQVEFENKQGKPLYSMEARSENVRRYVIEAYGSDNQWHQAGQGSEGIGYILPQYATSSKFRVSFYAGNNRYPVRLNEFKFQTR